VSPALAETDRGDVALSGSGWKGIAVMKWRTPRQPVDREVLSSSQDQATPLIGRQFRRVTDPHGLI